MRHITEAPIEIRTVYGLCLNLQSARKELERHPTYEMAREVQIQKREMDMAVNINRRIIRSIT